MKRKQILVWGIVIAAVAAIAAVLAVQMHHWRPGRLIIRGAVIRNDSDTRKQLPIAAATVTASDGVTSVATTSDSSGYYKLTLPGVAWPGRTINLTFRHAGYQPLDLQLEVSLRLTSKEIHIAAMDPIFQQSSDSRGAELKQSVVSNIRIRYTVNSEKEENIGSAARTFQVINKGDVPCNGKQPCSPDRNWKASTASLELDAGQGNAFRSVRVSCIAGPCPFTRIDSSGFQNPGQKITVSATGWSGTTTFLVEAEVYHTFISSNLRESYPVIFGRVLNFSVPPTQEGVSIEAEIDGTPMVFPLGPDLYLSWADCTMQKDSEGAASYRCELRPAYRF